MGIVSLDSSRSLCLNGLIMVFNVEFLAHCHIPHGQTSTMSPPKNYYMLDLIGLMI